jgi:hypothetical protein
MLRVRTIWLVALLLAAGCDRGGQPAPAPSAAAAPAAVVAAPAAVAIAAAGAATLPPATALQIDRASIIAFVNRWAQLQNEGDFVAYSSLYAPGFTGIKRVAEETSTFDRSGWLEDRRRLLAGDARVRVSKLAILRSDATVGVVFEQQYSTATFADRGSKVLTLQRMDDERAPEGWRIVREEMLTSTLAPEARSRRCGALLEQLAGAGPGVRYFANLASSTSATARWAAVGSHDDADSRADDGYASELWGLLSGDEWQAAFVSMSPPSGDWVREASLCFRPDGTVAQVIDRYRGFSPDEGLVEDIVSSTYARDGAELSSKTDVRNLGTGKPAQTRSYFRPPPLLVKKTAALPFAALLE